MNQMNQAKTVPLILLASVLFSAACSEQEVPTEQAAPGFISFVEDGEYSGRLETALTSYVNPDGVRVDLIAAVHIADASYYELLREVFGIYDAVLYELVAPEGYKPSPDASPDSIVSLFQRGFCRLLDLTFQLDGVDYTAANFVHADLSPSKLSKIMEERGENFFTIFMRVLNAQMLAMSKGMGSHMTGEALLDAFRSDNRAGRLKYLVGREMKHVESLFAEMESGEEGKGSILLGERNKIAIEKLEERISNGEKKLAIFYGAGHMPDMEARLLRDLGFVKQWQEWMTAWEIDGGEEGE